MVVGAGFKPARNKKSEDFVSLWFVNFYVFAIGSHLEGGRVFLPLDSSSLDDPRVYRAKYLAEFKTYFYISSSKDVNY